MSLWPRLWPTLYVFLKTGKCPIPCGIPGLPTNARFLGPTRVCQRNDIFIGSVIFARLICVPNTQTLRRDLNEESHPYALHAAVRPSNAQISHFQRVHVEPVVSNFLALRTTKQNRT